MRNTWSKMSGWWVSGLSAAWGALLLGVLQIRYRPLDTGHSVCGSLGLRSAIATERSAFHRNRR